MNKITIRGSYNSINIDYDSYAQGSKNAALPVLCAIATFDKRMAAYNVPSIQDVNILLKLFREIGLKFSYNKRSHTFTKYPNQINRDINLSRSFYEIRGGFYLIAALINKCQIIRVRGYEIGGCKIGKRGYSNFVKVFEFFGFEVKVKKGELVFYKAKEFQGGEIILNDSGIVASGIALILASQFTVKTKLVGFSKAPELNDLSLLLKDHGTVVKTVGRSILVDGKRKKSVKNGSFKIRVQDDRIVLATYAILCCITGGTFSVAKEKLRYLKSFLALLKKVNCNVELKNKRILISRSNNLYPANVKITDYPGVPTDIQPLITLLLCTIPGKSTIYDRIFPTRDAHIVSLQKLGQQISTINDRMTIDGGKKFKGATLRSNDLRCSAALLAAACIATGMTKINNFSNIFRGYEYLVKVVKRNRIIYV